MSKQSIVITVAVLAVGAVAAGVWFMGSSGDGSDVNVTAPRNRTPAATPSAQADQGPLARSAPRAAPADVRRLDASAAEPTDDAEETIQPRKQQRKERRRTERRRRPQRRQQTEEAEPLVPMEPVGKEKTRKVRGK